MCVELYQWLIELERTFILPLAPRWVRHSYLSKRLQTIPYTCGISRPFLAPLPGSHSVGEYFRVHLFALSLSSFYFQYQVVLYLFVWIGDANYKKKLVVLVIVFKKESDWKDE